VIKIAGLIHCCGGNVKVKMAPEEYPYYVDEYETIVIIRNNNTLYRPFKDLIVTVIS
jgi:hypothetical protein